MKKLIFIIFATAMVFVSCQSTKQSNSQSSSEKNSIFYKTWNLQAVSDGKTVVNVKSEATMTIEEMEAAIYTGINTANLGVKVEANKIKFSDGPMTKMAGAEEDMIIENNLMSALFSADSYKVSGETLFLYTGDTVLAKFKRQDLL